ncbi:MAG: response regulator [Candidatus Eremiobacteraeota bacterium]|nr:response regulator [Candidatus Eremiobacteraeota bacterium]
MIRVLVVDDEPANVLYADLVLRNAGYDVLAAESADEAERLAREMRPVLALIDLSLRGSSGTDLVRRLRANAATRGLRIALYTATLPNAALRDFMAMTAIEHVIPKPSEPSEFLAAVESALR